MGAAIRVDGVGKRYHVPQAGPRAPYQTLRESLAAAAAGGLRRLRRGAGGQAAAADAFWALRDVSFEVQPGEVVGIIGRNGAGKSTLLKVLSRITRPTTGRVELNGRVGSLLEVGTGFHPELTGRENIFLNGSILGMSRAEVARKFDEIVQFAEVEQFLDTPVKRYSSGMYVRLAFAVAAHLEPEILIVDEVLAVGDASFQKKCLGKMGDVARGGRTILFVSHTMTAVQSLCSRVVLMTGGRVGFAGDVRAGTARYLADGAPAGAFERRWAADAPAAPEVGLLGVRLARPDGRTVDGLTTADPFRVEFDYEVRRDGLPLNLSLVVYNEQEVCVFASPSVSDPEWFRRPFPAGRYRSGCAIPGDLLNDGSYRVRVLFVRDMSAALLDVEAALRFEVADAGGGRGDWHGPWIGAVRPRLAWGTARLEAA